MLFPTLDYILFLPLVVGLFWTSSWQWRLSILGAASIFFYGSWNWSYLPLLLLVSAMSWGLSLWIDQKKPGKWGMAACIGLLFVPLILFKYTDWLIWNINALGNVSGVPLDISSVGLALPVGISFFTFQAVAYVVDVRREGKPSRKFWPFFSFVAFFPQLVAGPIVRRNELLPQLEKRPLLQEGMVSEGLYRIIKGMLKKLIIADTLRMAIVDQAFADPGEFMGIEMWLALYAYTLQIYYDFSAYTDIAIGSALLFGIRLPENFRRPYKATCVAEFWRRWHITLSNWVRDYVYYPLGGSRTTSDWKVYRNIIITMVVIGLWHGASWNFVIYGILHGSAVGINRWRRKKSGRRPGDPLKSSWAWIWRFMLTFHFVVLARILFRADDLSSSWTILKSLSVFHWSLPRYNPLYLGIMLLAMLVHFTPEAWETKTKEGFKGLKNIFMSLSPATQGLVAAFGALLCWEIGASEAAYFIYYKF